MQTIKTFGFQSASGGGGGGTNTNLGNADLTATGARTFNISSNTLDFQDSSNSILNIEPTKLQFGLGGVTPLIEFYGNAGGGAVLKLFSKSNSGSVEITPDTYTSVVNLAIPEESGAIAVRPSLVGEAGKVLACNSAETGLEFSSLSSFGVSSIVAGTNITISPTTGIGAVTINSSGGGGGSSSTQVLFASFVDSGASTGLQEKTIPFNTQNEAQFGGSIANGDYEGFFFPPQAGTVESFQLYTTGSGSGTATLRAYQGFGSSTAILTSTTASFSGNGTGTIFTVSSPNSFSAGDVMVFTIQQTRPLGVFAIGIELKYS